MIMYMHVLSKEESANHEKKHLIEMDEWWDELKYRNKSFVYNQLKTVIEKIECTHDWYLGKSYDKQIMMCKCGLTKDVDEYNNNNPTLSAA